MKENYIYDLIDDVSKLLTKRKPKWPDNLDIEEQRELIEALIELYIKNEEYDKCIKLQKKLDKLK